MQHFTAKKGGKDMKSDEDLVDYLANVIKEKE